MFNMSKISCAKIIKISQDPHEITWIMRAGKQTIVFTDESKITCDFGTLLFSVQDNFSVYAVTNQGVFSLDLTNTTDGSVCIGSNVYLTLKDSPNIDNFMAYYEDMYFNSRFTHNDQIIEKWKLYELKQSKKLPTKDHSIVNQDTLKILNTQSRFLSLVLEERDQE